MAIRHDQIRLLFKLKLISFPIHFSKGVSMRCLIDINVAKACFVMPFSLISLFE